MIAIRNDDEILLEQIVEYRVARIKELIHDSINITEPLYFPRNLIITYTEYLLKPPLVRALNSKNEPFIKLLISESTEIIIECSKPGLSDHSSGLIMYLLERFSFQLLDSSLFESLEWLIRSSNNLMNAILKDYDSPIETKILLLKNYSDEGRKLDVLNNVVDRKRAEEIEEMFGKYFYSTLKMLDNILLKLIHQKKVELMESTIDVYRDLIFGVSALTHSNFVLTEVHQAQITHQILKSIKTAYINSVANEVTLVNNIKKFFSGPVMANPLYNKNKLTSALPIKNYLEAIEEVSKSYSIEQVMFAFAGGDEVKDASENFVKDFGTHKESFIMMLTSFEKILVNIKKRNSQSKFNECNIINDQIITIEEAMKHNSINDEEIGKMIISLKGFN